MSVQSEITRISNGVNDALNAVEERGVTVSEIDNVDTLGGLIRSIPYGSPPILPKEKRQDIIDLTNKYYNARGIEEKDFKFTYVGGIKRNDFASKNCFNSDGLIKLNCNMLVQLIWAGISPDALIGKSDSYTGDISNYKDFNWGYWFKFPFRKAYHLTAPNGYPGDLTIYGFVKPHADNYEDSYSTTTYYTPNGTSANRYQFPKPFIGASDMARELKFLGCEIPLNEVMSGDIIFTKASRLDDGIDDEINKSVFMNINHVALVTNVTRKENCDITFIECCTYYPQSIGTASLSSTKKDNVTPDIPRIFRAVDVIDRIVMVARHPAAFGISSPVPDKITAI